ncbi:hypothetical protein DFJ74DRAFT_48384 [Hyaloraphidium curvatum]|nr:hypothetical protein DFJ74DRAFT_48384 [Hyaloraphidium curvatum]
MPPEIADNIAAFAVGLPNIPDGELTADQRRILAVLLVLHGQGNPFRDFAIAHLWHTVAFPQPSFGRIVRALESSRFRDRYGAAVRRVNLRGGQDPSDLARGSQVQLHHRIVELLDRFAETVTGMRNLADLTVIGQLGRHFRAPVPVAQRIVERATRIRRGPFPAQQRVHLQGCATSSDSLAGLFASSSWNRLTSVVLGEDAVMGNVLTSGLISSIGRHVPDGLNGIEWLRRIDIRMHCLARPRFIQFFFSKCRRVADFAWVLPEASDGAVAGFEQKVAGNGHLRCLVLREPGGLTASEDRSAWLRMAAAGRQTLKVLELHKFDLSTGPTGAAFAQLLPQLHLEGLSLTECTLTPATSQAIAACTQLRAFRLSRPTGHGVRIRAILDALPRDLEHLDLELDSAAGVLQGVRRFAELRWARLRLDMGNGDGVEIADALASLQQLEEAEVAEAVADVVRGRLPRLRVGTVAWEP